jgi:hypothetical protein
MERVERGYVWPLSAARDRESGSVYGVGMRVGPFRLAANLQELVEGQPEEYTAPRNPSHEEWVAMIDEKVEAVEAYASEVGRLDRQSLRRSIAGTIAGLANQYSGWLDPKASVIEFGFTDDHAARLENLAGWTELVQAYETERGR